jgi:molybdopterin-containing oxidoreductase family iron-sulfur binding subunit
MDAMKERSQKIGQLPELPVLGQPVRARVPEWVHDDAMLVKLGPEFAESADLPPDEPTRRHFLKIMGASAALATASGCFQQPQEEIVPFVRAPEQIIPGKPLYYATAMTLGGASLGLLVETHMGRPTKVEGNPLHPAVPASMTVSSDSPVHDLVAVGATDAYAQAVVLSLYDPDRSQTTRRAGQISTWEAFYTELHGVLDRVAPSGGEGLRLLAPPIVSPTLADQMRQVLEKYPNARLHHWEPINDDNAVAGARLAFGEAVVATYLNRPDVVLSLDADFFTDGPMRLQLARKVRGHVPQAGVEKLPRLYVAETSSTITGAAADHRVAVSYQGLIEFAVELAKNLGHGGGATAEWSDGEVPRAWKAAVATDLTNARGRSLVVAGRGQPPLVHAIAHLLNASLGNVGTTIEYRPPIAQSVDSMAQSILDLARAMEAKEVEALIILGGNPAYDAPANARFAELLSSVPFTMHLSPYFDETSTRSTWHVPESHLFEAWSDTRATDGTASIVQPLLAPLYESKTAHDVLAALMGVPSGSSHDLVRGFWQRELGAAPNDPAFERAWRTALHDGVIAGTATPAQTPAVAGGLMAAIAQQAASLIPAKTAPTLRITYRHDSSVWDGRFANNAWLQELPRPFTKLTWDNVVLMSPRTASANRVRTGDVVSIESGEVQIEVPAFVVPTHPDQTLTLQLGYGRQEAGRVGNNVGTDVYRLRTSDAMWFAGVTAIQNTGRSVELATTQHHHHMEGRGLVRSGTLAEFKESPQHPSFMERHGHGEPAGSMFPEPVYEGYKWGMVVNQSACIGCNACVAACQSENNIPVVGKDQVWRGREMHWLRIDNYYVGNGDWGLGAGERNKANGGSQSPVPSPQSPDVYHQPVMCQHCELAPCEPVCPVMATTHSAEGLNEMTYNRCIGTRYCSNNCPYKVRRFNFFDYNTELREDETMQLRPNPDVTVRSRGVMEKCTFCVQRINAGRIAADIGNRQVADGEIVTACQAACPTQAFTFGDLNDARSQVRKLAESGLNYSLLGELNTRPRTTYLARVRDPNSELS